jgi:hypothetical protein
MNTLLEFCACLLPFEVLIIKNRDPSILKTGQNHSKLPQPLLMEGHNPKFLDDDCSVLKSSKVFMPQSPAPNLGEEPPQVYKTEMGGPSPGLYLENVEIKEKLGCGGYRPIHPPIYSCTAV